jgi:hypothetical protein
MPSIVPTALIDVLLESLFQRMFRCYGQINSLFGRPWELVRNALKLLANQPQERPNGGQIREFP